MIFISYRRIDTQAMASHAYDALRRHYGAEQVFMDVRDGIHGGEEFAKVLEGALAQAQVLLVMIGAEWARCERDGRRRLDHEDDWVRAEVQSGLQRGILVLPVLCAGAPLPGAGDIPEALRGLLGRQARPLRDDSWDADFNTLLGDLARVMPADDVASARAGLAGLRALIQSRDDVAEAIGRSREVLDLTYRQLARLEAHKVVHDALHTIEHDCLWPLQQGARAASPRTFRLRFANARQRIVERLAAGQIAEGLAADITEQLALADAALQSAVDQAGEATRDAAVAELQLLVSGLPVQLDAGIADAARELGLGRLLDLMDTVRANLPGAAADPELQPFVAGVEALGRLRSELEQRVLEHGRIQRLDAKLRTVCNGATPPALLAREWQRVRQQRATMGEPFSAPWREAQADLTALEQDVDALIDKPAEAAGAMLGVLYAVAAVFRDVDTELKDFCLRLSDVGQPLRTVLRMV